MGTLCTKPKPPPPPLPPGGHAAVEDLDPRKLPTFVPPLRTARVVKVYDGDTITVATQVPGLADRTVFKFSVRLRGIDTPEMRGSTPSEKTAAIAARDALRARIMGRDVELGDVGTEKYGRLLCNVHCDGVHLNQWLVEQGHAVPYDGGTKAVFGGGGAAAAAD